MSEYEIERREIERIRQERVDRLAALGLSVPPPPEITLSLARAVASAERAVREYVRGQVAA